MTAIPEFKILPINALKRVCKELKEVSFKKNKVLFKEGDPLNYIYFVKSGEFKVTREVSMPLEESTPLAIITDESGQNQQVDNFTKQAKKERNFKYKQKIENHVLEIVQA